MLIHVISKHLGEEVISPSQFQSNQPYGSTKEFCNIEIKHSSQKHKKYIKTYSDVDEESITTLQGM